MSAEPPSAASWEPWEPTELRSSVSRERDHYARRARELRLRALVESDERLLGYAKALEGEVRGW